jgi:hypothetical protein
MPRAQSSPICASRAAWATAPHKKISMLDLYSKDATPQVRAAIYFLCAQGCRHFYPLGICTGSFVAFQSALAARLVSDNLQAAGLLPGLAQQKTPLSFE